MLDTGGNIVKVKEKEVIKRLSHLQGLSGPGFEPTCSDSKAQFSSALHCYTIKYYYELF